MKKIVLSCFIVMISFHSFAQTLFIENGALVKINEPTAIDGVKSNTPTLVVKGNMINLGTLINNGEIQFQGDVTNVGTYTSNGDDVFAENGTQFLIGNFNSSNSFFNLVLDKGGSNVSLYGNISVSEAIYLTDGVILGNGNRTHLLNSATSALHSAAPSGSNNNFINGDFRQNINTGSYTFYVGDGVHNNQKVSVNFNNTGGANFMDVSYNSAGAGATSISACGGVYDKQSGTWTLTPDGTNGSYDYNITLEAGGANLAAISGSVYDGILKDGIFITNPCAHVSGNNTVNGLTSFSDFKKVATSSAVLPISLLDFSAKKMDWYNNVTWVTSSEYNNRYFNLQKSTDGLDFYTLSKVNSQAIQGNSSTSLSYSVQDAKPEIGNNFYRLEQVDLDGHKNYSKVINVMWDAINAPVTLSPNPATSNAQVHIYSNQDALGTIKILDMSGRIIKEIKLNYTKGYNQVDLSLESLSQGMYQLNVYSDQTLMQGLKLNKL